MAPTNSAVVIGAAMFLLFFSISPASAFNITRILEKYPDYSQIHDLLTKTQLAADINKRSTITVLAVPNSAIGDLASKPEEDQMRILCTHVILDYYDGMKLKGIKGNDTMLTTLLQTTGATQGRQGFVRVGHPVSGGTAFASAVKNSPLDAKFEGVIVSRPFNISVLRVSQPIKMNGVDGNWTTPPQEAEFTAPPPPEEAAAPSPDVVIADATAQNTAADSTTTTPSPAPSTADAEADAGDKSSAAVIRVAYGVVLAAPLLLAQF